MKERAVLWRMAGMTIGLLVAGMALASPHLGLGKGEDFLLYRLCLVSRTAASGFGVALALISLCWRPLTTWVRRVDATARDSWPFVKLWFVRVKRRFSRRIRAAVSRLGRSAVWIAGEAWRTARVELGAVGAAYRRDLRPATSPFPPTPRVLITLTWQALLVGVVTGVAFWLTRHDLLGYVDGHGLLTMGLNQKDLSTGGLALSVNPLQGLGDIWMFNIQMMIEFLPVRLGFEADHLRVAIHTISAVELFIVAATISYWLSPSLVKATAAGWLAVLLICPITYPPLIACIWPTAPHMVSIIALPLFILVVWTGLGRGTHAADAFRVLLITSLLWMNFLQVRYFVLCTHPFLAVFCGTFLVASWSNRSEFRRKLGWSVVLLSLLLASGYFTIVYGLIRNTAIFFFPAELNGTTHELQQGSLLFRDFEPAGVNMIILALVGALVHFAFGRGDRRHFALALLIMVGCIVTAAKLWERAAWIGASPFYYEYVLWPVYPIFAVFLVAPLVSTLWGRWVPDAVRYARYRWLVLPVIATLAIHLPNLWFRGFHIEDIRGYPYNAYPPKPTVLTEELRDKIGMAIGAPFRGRVATMTGQYVSNNPDEDTREHIDHNLIKIFGNDHRMMGLWYYNIPTLFEINTIISPWFYVIAKTYLSREDDVQSHAVVMLRRLDIRILRLLGVSHILTDRLQPVNGSRRVRVMALPDDKGVLALDEVARPNLGLSPTEILPQGSAAETVEWLGREENDLERRAVVAGPPPGPLVPARDIRITVIPDGLEIQAESAGRSLVVIPFQYSHCWEVVPRAGSSSPDLRRVDLLLTGLVFEGKLDAAIRIRLGPFQGWRCRLTDLADSRALAAP